ncbi:MAG TPA: peptidase E [Ktedonobacterales bacterium]
MTNERGADKRRIVAIGGCTLTPESSDGPLFRSLVEMTGASRPLACFIPTASGENLEYTVNFAETFGALGCATRHLNFFPNPPTADLASYLLECDLIFVGGGNTKNMLALWREWGVDAILRQAWERGTVLAGVSAGMICWFEQGLTDSVPGPLTPLPCLGFLPGSACPHFDGEAERRPTLHRLLAAGAMVPGLAADDHAALRFDGETLGEVLTTSPSAGAFTLRADSGQIIEMALATRALA